MAKGLSHRLGTPALLCGEPCPTLQDCMQARRLAASARGPRAAMLNRTLISIVDDDELFRESMRKLVMLLGYTVEAFPSAADFLASPVLRQTACLVSDVQMPGMTGVELHRH